MGLTALRNKQGIKGKPANMPGGGGAPDAATLQNLYQTAANKGPEAAHSMVGQIGGPQAQQAVQSAAGSAQAGGDPMKAPRYQKMLADGVDPDVVRKRATDFQQGKLPGQQGVSGSGQTPGIVPGMPGQPTGKLPLAPGAGGGSIPGRSPGAPTGDPRNADGNQVAYNDAPPLPNGLPMGGTPLPLVGREPAQGGALSPGAWGALGGGAPRLPNGEPMGGAGAAADGPSPALNGYLSQINGIQSQTGPGGAANPQLLAAITAARGGYAGGGGGGTVAGFNGPGTGLPSPGQGLPYGNDGQVRQAPPSGGPTAFTGPGLQSGPPGAGAAGGLTPFIPHEQPIPGPGAPGGGGGLTFMGGNDPSQGGRPPLPNGQPMANIPQATPDPQARQQLVARGIASRMGGGGGAFNQ